MSDPALYFDFAEKILRSAKLTEPYRFVASSGCIWPYQESPGMVERIHNSLQARFKNYKNNRRDKTTQPFYTIAAGPGAGKSRLLDELPSLFLKAAKQSENKDLIERMESTYVFKISFENGISFDASKANQPPANAIASRMWYQLCREDLHINGIVQGSHHRMEGVLAKLAELKAKERDSYCVMVLVDGMHHLHHKMAKSLLGHISNTALSGKEFFIVAVAGLVFRSFESFFSQSMGTFVNLMPPRLAKPEDVIPDVASLPQLSLLRSYMGGHPRALEILFNEVENVKASKFSTSISELESHVIAELRRRYFSEKVNDSIGDILAVVLGRRKFDHITAVVTPTLTVDNVQRFGLVQWLEDGDKTLDMPPIFIKILAKSLNDPLLMSAFPEYARADDDASDLWRFFEKFVAIYRAIKMRAFAGRECSLGELYDGARITTTAKDVRVQVPLGIFKVTVCTKQFDTKGSSVSHLPENATMRYSTVYVNGRNAPYGDVFLDNQIVDGSNLREAIACKLLTGTSISDDKFQEERNKAASHEDMFVLVTPNVVNVDLNKYESDLVAIIDEDCYKDYFGSFTGVVYWHATQGK